MENLIRTILPELDERYKTYALNHHFPGYAYGILLDGKLIHTASGGFIDTIKKIPATPKSMFRIASMTKSFTAMAVLKLRDEGNLRLDDPVEHYIPQMRGQRLTTDDADITIRDLLVHSAGLPTDDPWADRLLDQKEEDLFLLLEKKLNFSSSPGTAFEYSNLGYTLLGSLIQKASGLSYQEYINKTILGPLGMCAFWDYKDAPQDRLARGYRFKDAKREEEPLLR
ncbi:MAG: serine hydrolase domain-containing protein, partial [Parachlamydiaceae bacterium]